MGRRRTYTHENPYEEIRTIERLDFTTSKGEVSVNIVMDFESWKICHNQWKDMGKPSVGDKLRFKISPQVIEP